MHPPPPTDGLSLSLRRRNHKEEPVPDDIGKTLIRRAREWGAADVRIEHGGKHPRLTGHYKGVAFMFVFPGSTGDRRAELNCLSNLRRVLGVEREEKPQRRTAKRRSPLAKSRVVPRARAVEPIRSEDRYYAPLAQLRASMAAAVGHATEPAEQLLRLRTPFLGPHQRFVTI